MESNYSGSSCACTQQHVVHHQVLPPQNVCLGTHAISSTCNPFVLPACPLQKYMGAISESMDLAASRLAALSDPHSLEQALQGERIVERGAAPLHLRSLWMPALLPELAEQALLKLRQLWHGGTSCRPSLWGRGTHVLQQQ